MAGSVGWKHCDGNGHVCRAEEFPGQDLYPGLPVGNDGEYDIPDGSIEAELRGMYPCHGILFLPFGCLGCDPQKEDKRG